MRGAAVAFATLAVAALAFAARADALIYWANAAVKTDTIGRANLDGTGANPGFIKVVGGFPNGVAVDGAHIYWTVIGTQFSPNSIGRADVSGANVNPSFIPRLRNAAEAVVVDGAHVYWTALLNQSIGRANLDGTGADEDFICGGRQPHRHRGRQRPPVLVQLRQQRDWQRQRRRLDGQPEPRLRRLRARRGGGRRVDLRAPPPPTIADLVAEVTEGGLPRGTERSLLAKLKGARESSTPTISTAPAAASGPTSTKSGPRAGRSSRPPTPKT